MVLYKMLRTMFRAQVKQMPRMPRKEIGGGKACDRTIVDQQTNLTGRWSRVTGRCSRETKQPERCYSISNKEQMAGGERGAENVLEPLIAENQIDMLAELTKTNKVKYIVAEK